MRFMVDGIDQDFVPIREFRQTYQLPDDFEVARFEPKDYSGLGRIEAAGVSLNSLRERMLTALPDKHSVAGWITALPAIVMTFEQELRHVNACIGLREAEIGFAVSGFADVLQQYLFALMRANLDNIERTPSFRRIYGEWLASTMRVSQRVHYYGEWTVQLVTHAYGRCGLIVRINDDTHYVYDSSLGCPVEGFMVRLLNDISTQIAAAL